jgi:hypothetical protein
VIRFHIASRRLIVAVTRRGFSSRVIVGLYAALVFALNAYIARFLFSVDFTQQMESIESSYMSISRWAMDHWNDRAWFPLWFGGSPFHRVYQPGLHLTVAEVARNLSWTPEHAYHFLTGLAYAIGPAALFLLCYKATGRKGYALVAGILYSLVSTTAILCPTVRGDLGSTLLPWRYRVLVHYGEGPHTTAVAMIPIVLWVIDRAVSRRNFFFILCAPLAIATVVLTNWPGAMGLGMGIIAYGLATLGRGCIRQWLMLAGIGSIAYLIAIPWTSPSIIALVLRNAQQSDSTSLNGQRLALAGLLIFALAVMHFVLQRKIPDVWFRFFLYFTVITGAVSVGREWFGWRLMPQPNRFQLEFDLAAAGTAAFAIAAVFRRVPKRWSFAATLVAVALCCEQVRRASHYAAAITKPLDISSTIEYQMAKWFDANMRGRRVFAPGNVSLWMNMFTDVPQMGGCCDQGIPNQEDRIAVYTIYTGQNAGPRDAEISLAWLKAYGAAAIGVTGPNSAEYFKPYWNPRKFDHILPEAWHQGDNTIFDVPRPSSSLAHVVNDSVVVRQAPENGLAIEPLQPLVSALDHEMAPFATFEWVNQHEARIKATVAPHEVVFVQVTYSRGWRATESGASLKITQDALGMMEIHPGRTGLNNIRLVYDGGPEAAWVREAQIGGFLILGLWSSAVWFTGGSRKREHAAHTEPAAQQ